MRKLQKAMYVIIFLIISMFLTIVTIGSLDLFRGSAANGVSNSFIALARCKIDKKRLPQHTNVGIKVHGDALKKIMQGNFSDFSLKNPITTKFNIQKRGEFFFYETGIYTNSYDEITQINSYARSGPDICLIPRRYAGVMAYYYNSKNELFQVTYSPIRGRLTIIQI